MAFVPSLLHDIHKRRSDWIVKVRVARKWFVPSNNDLNLPPSMELVIVDAEGDRIHASIKKTLIKKFDKKFQEGGLYYISNFSILDNKSYKITTSNYKIQFMATTEVINVGDKNFTRDIFKIKSFDEILSLLNVQDAGLVDVVGKVVGKGALKQRLNTKYIDIEMEDLELNKLKCTLWGSYADEILTHIQTSGNNGLVVLLQLCKPKNFQGQLTLSNSFYATRIIVDSTFPEIAEFKAKLINSGNSSQKITQLSSTTTCSGTDEIESGEVDVKSVEDIITCSHDGFYWVVAQITNVLDRNWSFISCSRCMKKLKNKDTGFFCDTCDKLETNATPRYKVRVNVVDGSQCATFLLWDQACETLIGKTALQLREQLCRNASEEQKAIDNDYSIIKGRCPEDIESLVGRIALFKVSVKQDNISGTDKVYSVGRVSDDENLIKKFQKTGFCMKRRSDVILAIKEAGEEVIEINDSEDEKEEKTPISTSNKRRHIMSSEETATNFSPSDGGSTTKYQLDKIRNIKIEKD